MMKKHKHICPFGLIIILLCLVFGCQSEDSPTISPHPTDIDAHLQLTETKVQSTKTIQPTEAEIPVVTEISEIKAPTDIVIPESSIPTSIPTLTTENAISLVQELLETNGDCQFSCIWGLEPGKSSLFETQTFLSQLGILMFQSGFNEDEQIGYAILRVPDENDLLLNIFITFGADKGILEWVGLSAEMNQETDDGYELVFGDTSYHQFFQAYFPPQVLSTLGEPPGVLISISTDDPNWGGWSPFNTRFIYPELGIVVNYTSAQERFDNQVIGCINEAFVEVGVWDTAHMSYEETRFFSPYYKTLEESTSLTIDEFVELISDSNNTACIETVLDIWIEQ